MNSIVQPSCTTSGKPSRGTAHCCLFPSKVRVVIHAKRSVRFARVGNRRLAVVTRAAQEPVEVYNWRGKFLSASFLLLLRGLWGCLSVFYRAKGRYFTRIVLKPSRKSFSLRYLRLFWPVYRWPRWQWPVWRASWPGNMYQVGIEMTGERSLTT